jgi:transposase
MEWVGRQQFEDEATLETFEDLLEDVAYRTRKLQLRTRRVEEMGQRREILRRKVGWISCFAGFDRLSATALSVELYDPARFGSAGQVMSYVGTTPSEWSSGEKERKGGVTRLGNERCRWILTEAAQKYISGRAFPKQAVRRHEGQPAWVVALALGTYQRLRRKARRLAMRGKSRQEIVMAIARELAGVIWVLLLTAEIGEGPPPNLRCAAA